MKLEAVGGAQVSLDILDRMDPVLDISPVGHDFAQSMVSYGHFVFSVDGDPMSQPWRITGMASIKKAITSRARAGTVIYACQDGASYTINASQVETCVSARVEYVRATDLTAFCREVGVEQWGIIRLGKDAGELLVDWPGAVAKQISVPWAEAAALPFEAKRQIGEWYEWASETLLVQRGYTK